MLLCCWFAYRPVSWEEIVTAVANAHGSAGFDPLDASGFGLGYVVWMAITFGIFSCAVWPTAVVRVCAVDDIKVVQRLYTWSSIGFMTRFIIPQFLAVCALAYFSLSEPWRAIFLTEDGKVVDDIHITLSALPIFLAQILPAGVIGLIAAGMLAAFMSTHDSYLLCWASVIVEDVIHPISGGKWTMRTRLLLARITILLIGIFLYAWSVFYPMSQDMLDYLAVSGAIYFIGAFAVLVCGLYWRGASTAGAYCALLVRLLAILGLPPVQQKLSLTSDRLGFELTAAHVGLSSMVLAVVVMIVVSVILPDQTAELKKGSTGDE